MTTRQIQFQLNTIPPFNTGPISIPVTAGNYTLAGNPYSDFLDLDSFFLNPNNVDTVTGPAVFWAFNTFISGSAPPVVGSGGYNYSDSDYAMYNVLGGCAAGTKIFDPSGTNGNGHGLIIPDGKVQYGTGFFIQGRNSGTATFTEAMRIPTGFMTGQGFKNSNSARSSAPVRHRIWLNMELVPGGIGSFGVLKQLLVGYAGNYGTTDIPSAGDSDRVFDAQSDTAIANPAITFYSLAVGSTKKLAIQGRNIADFATSDYFQLGFTASAGTYKFSATADGMFGTIPYMILDSTDGLAHPLPYTTTISATVPFGTPDETRFRIVFSTPPPVITLDLKLNIEGYYRTLTSNMDSVQLNQGSSPNPTYVGLVDVDLHYATAPFAFVTTSSQGILHTDGSVSVTFPGIYAGSNYYISVRHRNAIETCSALPIILNIGTNNYDFTIAASQAYDSNQVEVNSGVFAFYSGDIDQDEIVSLSDYSYWESDFLAFSYGDFSTDLNGDGIVDYSDYSIWDANGYNFTYSHHPW
jgi:hypothetical protein